MHEEHVSALFAPLNVHEFVIMANECEFGAADIKFLGYLVTPQGVKLLDAKVTALQNFLYTDFYNCGNSKGY